MKCIRVLADVNQINQCKKELTRIELQTKSISKTLGLAGNAVRLKILYLLYQEEKMCPCDLSDVLNMTVPAISQHLRKLKEGGMVVNKKVGQIVFYSLHPKNTSMIKPMLKFLSSSTKEVALK